MRAVALALVAIGCMATATGQVSPFNGKEIMELAPGGTYRLILSGHLHGASNDRSGYPASTILANIEMINGLGADLFLSTGDLFLDPQKEYEQYERTLFTKLQVPLLNAPGNHDKSAFYDSQYGPTHGVYSMGEDRIVLLDTERKNGSLDQEQLGLLEGMLQGQAAPHIYIISHRPIWAEDDERYGPLFEGNTRSLLSTNYQSHVRPLIEKLADRSHVIWVSGSMAGAGPSIFFQEEAANWTFIQTAIRNLEHDALLIADVSPGGIEWSAISLTGKELLAPQAYNAEWWWAQREKKEPFNWRLLPYLITSTVRSGAFWYGAVAGILLILILVRLLRRGL